ncbi:lactate utilization protein [Anaerosalibacter massiliensis]|uniref:Lactate utilization protein n=1 Tax=Anaerosalibacter massiliensis TaxID=1347392 RepID=A0A9X2MK54_9FIRM|nr:lactate utilization protein [Anaerosalibacter massiliensis]MCR2045545.1 lactate utilization protein [Anaerosalibacter massiliensis]
MRKNIINTIKSLREKGYKTKLYTNVEDAKKELIEKIDTSDTVGIGGSMTVFDMNIYEALIEKNVKTYWHWKASNEEVKDIRDKADRANIYITSTNAITEDGKLVNMDGVGNRVASMFYGHDKVFIIVGTNKICKDYETAKDRIRNVAAPKNTERLVLDTPCRLTGRCSDCKSSARICNIETIIHRKPADVDMTIFLIDEELGY